MVIIDPLGFNRERYSPLTNITPFTYRDGFTYLEALQKIRHDLNDSIEYINVNFSGLSDSWELTVGQITDAFNLSIAQVNQQIVIAEAAAVAASASADRAEAAASSVPAAQDVAITAIFNNLSSNLRAAMDGVYAGKSYEEIIDTGRLSAAQIALLATTESVDAQIVALTVAKADVSVQVTVETGRLSEANLDATYTKIDKRNDVVIIGSSNSQSGWGWTGPMCARNGWIEHNYSVGGSGFTEKTSPGGWYNQAEQAIIDPAFNNADVKYIFVVDMSNNIRGNTNVAAYAAELYALLNTNFLNARVILVPAILTYVNDNWNSQITRYSTRKRYVEARNAALPYPNISVINYSWLWIWDAGNWIQGVPPDYHPNSAGYSRVAQNIEAFVHYGELNDNGIGATAATAIIAASYMGIGVYAERSGNMVTVTGNASSYVLTPQDSDLVMIPQGMGPQEVVMMYIVSTERKVYSAYVYPNGTVRTINPLPGGQQYWFTVTYMVM